MSQFDDSAKMEMSAMEQTRGLDRIVRPTIRQELESRKAHLVEQIKLVDDALEALYPESEKLLNALRKVGM